MAHVASLLGVQASLSFGFAADDDGEPSHEIEIAVADWSERNGPAVIGDQPDQHPFSATALVTEAPRPARDLVGISFRVSNTLGRDPASNVFAKVMLPSQWEAYESREFEKPFMPIGFKSIRVDESSRRAIMIEIERVSNSVHYTTEAVWLRLPKEIVGQHEIPYSISADRLPRKDGALALNVKEN